MRCTNRAGSRSRVCTLPPSSQPLQVPLSCSKFVTSAGRCVFSAAAGWGWGQHAQGQHHAHPAHQQNAGAWGQYPGAYNHYGHGTSGPEQPSGQSLPSAGALLHQPRYVQSEPGRLPHQQGLCEAPAVQAGSKQWRPKNRSPRSRSKRRMEEYMRMMGEIECGGALHVSTAAGNPGGGARETEMSTLAAAAELTGEGASAPAAWQMIQSYPPQLVQDVNQIFTRVQALAEECYTGEDGARVASSLAPVPLPRSGTTGRRRAARARRRA